MCCGVFSSQAILASWSPLRCTYCRFRCMLLPSVYYGTLSCVSSLYNCSRCNYQPGLHRRRGCTGGSKKAQNVFAAATKHSSSTCVFDILPIYAFMVRRCDASQRISPPTMVCVRLRDDVVTAVTELSAIVNCSSPLSTIAPSTPRRWLCACVRPPGAERDARRVTANFAPSTTVPSSHSSQKTDKA